MNDEQGASIPLGLRSVLIDSLPADLLTETAPSRYTVEAVFNRRPKKDEILQILGSATRSFLSARGYTDVVLEVSDRRLIILNTTLEELRNGLSRVLGDRLLDISASSTRRQDEAARGLKEHEERERQRVQSLTQLAQSIDFTGAERRHSESVETALEEGTS